MQRSFFFFFFFLCHLVSLSKADWVQVKVLNRAISYVHFKCYDFFFLFFACVVSNACCNINIIQCYANAGPRSVTEGTI